MKILALVLSLGLIFSGSAIAAEKKKKSAPVFSAKSYLIADMDGEILKENKGDSIRPIASLTKLMVGLLAAEQNLDEMLPVPEKREFKTSIPRGIEYLSRRDLLTLSLVKSDNFASRILCDNIPNCIDAMNSRAVSIGMSDTKFVEPTGLSRDNISTAHDLLKLLLVSAESDTMKGLSSLPRAEIEAENKTIKVSNTNPLTSRFSVILSKTGFTRPAGGCLVMIMNSAASQRVLILLGSRNTKTRVREMERLIKQNGL